MYASVKNILYYLYIIISISSCNSTSSDGAQHLYHIYCFSEENIFNIKPYLKFPGKVLWHFKKKPKYVFQYYNTKNQNK